MAAPVVHSHAATGAISFVALIGAYQLIDGAFAGWDAPSYFAGENEDAARSVPRALFGGIAVTAGLYIAVVAALLYALGAAGMGATDLPFSVVLAELGGPDNGTIVAGIAMLIVVSCANTNIMAAPRFLYALTEDQLLPRAVSWVNKGGTPYVALVMTAAATFALTLTGSFDLAFGLIATLGAATLHLRLRRILRAALARAGAASALPGDRLSGAAGDRASDRRGEFHPLHVDQSVRRGLCRGAVGGVCSAGHAGAPRQGGRPGRRLTRRPGARAPIQPKIVENLARPTGMAGSAGLSEGPDRPRLCAPSGRGAGASFETGKDSP